jgi:hypothetical protein
MIFLARMASTFAQPIEITQVASFANNPLVIEPRLFTASTPWELHFEARFANDCLADNGLNMGFVDVPPPSTNTGQRKRVVVVQQRQTGLACPEIFNPVTRPHVAEMPADPTLDAVTFLDAVQVQIDGAATETRQPYVIDPAQPQAAQPFSGATRRTVAELLFPEGRLPVLTDVTVAGERVSSVKFRYTISFDIVFPARCFADGRLHAEIIESRTSIGDQTAAKVIDWLFVVNEPPDGCSETADGEAAVRSATVSSEVTLILPRQVAIVNVLIDEGARMNGPFAMFDLF